MQQSKFGQFFQAILKTLSRQNGSSSSASQSSSPQSPQDSLSNLRLPGRTLTMRWGAKVSQTFRNRIVWAADNLETEVDWLMSGIAFETGETFSASVKNGAGSGATGLIQFMPATARSMGTTVEHLASLTAEEQIVWVYRYFLPYKGKLKSLSDVYMAILWPAAIGKADYEVLWSQADKPTTYRQNAGLDTNKNAVITKGEAAGKVLAKFNAGALPGNVWTGYVEL